MTTTKDLARYELVAPGWLIYSRTMREALEAVEKHAIRAYHLFELNRGARVLRMQVGSTA